VARSIGDRLGPIVGRVGTIGRQLMTASFVRRCARSPSGGTSERVGILTRRVVKSRENGRERRVQKAASSLHQRGTLHAHSTGMRSLRREFGRGGAGVSLVGHELHVRHVKDWIRRLGWWGLWLVAQRCLQIWLADQTYTGRNAVALSRRGLY